MSEPSKPEPDAWSSPFEELLAQQPDVSGGDHKAEEIDASKGLNGKPGIDGATWDRR